MSAPSDLDAYIAGAAAVLKLPLDPQWHVGVRANLETSLAMAALVEEFALPDEAEPAPVYLAAREG